MRALKLVGYWQENEGGGNWIHPAALVDPNWESHDRVAIIRYLRGGVRVNEDLGFSFNRFKTGSPDRELGNAEMSDGTWVWPEGLAIYVERHNVRLPNEFIEHMKSLNFQIPAMLNSSQLERLPVDTGFWKSWCAKQPRI